MIPPSAFYNKTNKYLAENFVRVCFFKKDENLQKATEILQKWAEKNDKGQQTTDNKCTSNALFDSDITSAAAVSGLNTTKVSGWFKISLDSALKNWISIWF